MPGLTSNCQAGSVRLRGVVPDDLPAFFQFQSDPAANRMAVSNPRSLDEFTAHWAKILSDQDVVARAILLDDELVGHVSCFKMDELDAVGYWIAQDYWGRGVASRALALLLDEVAVRPLHARAATTNVGSIRVLERCGFSVTGHRMSPEDDRFPACEETLLTLD